MPIAPRNLHDVLVSNFCVEIHNYNLNTWWSEGITIVGRIKSHDAQSNGQIFLSHRVLHIFKTTAKSYREQPLQNKAAETIFWILESKNVLIASIGNSVFDNIDNVKS